MRQHVEDPGSRLSRIGRVRRTALLAQQGQEVLDAILEGDPDRIRLPRGVATQRSHRAAGRAAVPVLAREVVPDELRCIHAIGQGEYRLDQGGVAGLGFLSSSGIVDIAEPLLERLAKESGELVRLAIVDGDRLTWVAKAQGTRKGLRYDPDMGVDARLSCTASGHAWLMTLSDERALELVSRQGFGQPKDYGPKAPTTVKALLGVLHAARTRGFAISTRSSHRE